MPHEIEDLAPYELGLVLRGRRERERERTRLAAWQVSTMINLHSTQKVTTSQLMGEEQIVGDLENDVDGLLEEYERAIEAQEKHAEREATGWLERAEAVELPVDDVGDGDA